MRIIHTSDWHLGNTFHEFSRDDEHRHFMQWLLGQLETLQPDALLIAGDLFDNVNPSASSQRVYYEFLASVAERFPGLQVVVIAGNHDSAQRLEAPNDFFELFNITVRGTVPRDAEQNVDYGRLIVPLVSRTNPQERVFCAAVPYLRPGDYPRGMSLSDSMNDFFSRVAAAAEACRTKNEPLVLMAHFYATGAEIAENSSERIWVGGQEGVEADALGKTWSYVALGHIHKRQCVAGESTVRYSGSILPMSFAEKNYRHGVECLDISPEGTCTRAFLEYMPTHPLCSLPEEGPLPLEEVISLLHDLPGRRASSDEAVWPYLEIKVLLDKVDPQMNIKIQQALRHKAVRFCCLRVFYNEPEIKGGPLEDGYTDLNNVSALDVAKAIYKSRYHVDLPVELEDLFNQAYAAALKDEQNEDIED